MTTANLFANAAGSITGDEQSTTVGTEFYVTTTAWVTEIRFWAPASGGDASVRTAAIYSTANGTSGTKVVGDVTLPVPVAGSWCTYVLPTPLELTPGVRYRVAILHPAGRYALFADYFASGPGAATATIEGFVVRPNSSDALAGRQGSYNMGASLAFPAQTWQSGCYFSDVTITDVAPTTGQTVTANPAVETDTAQHLGKAASRTLGVAVGTDAARALGRAKQGALTPAAESDAALPVGRSRRYPVGLASSTDAAQPVTVTGRRIVAVGAVTETSTATPVGRLRARTLAVVTETDIALAVGQAGPPPLGRAGSRQSAGPRAYGSRQSAGPRAYAGVGSRVPTAGG